MSHKILHSIKFSENTDDILEGLRTTYSPNKSFNNMVETLVENNPDFVAFKKKRKHAKK